MPMKVDCAFLFIGGVHQILHLAPVAAEVSRRRPHLVVHCLCADAASLAAAIEVRDRMNAPDLLVTSIAPGRFGRALATMLDRQAATKGPTLAAIRWRLRGARAIVVPERTSAILRWMGWRRLLIHFRHGAGDRAPASEKRLKAFDLIVVPGEKDVARALRMHGVGSACVKTCGYVKLDYLASTHRVSLRLFENDRPVVVYNPHFDADLSSWNIAHEILERFGRQTCYNLVFAPHIRAVENMSPHDKQAWRSFAVPGRIIIDLGSPRLFDMSYIEAADVYLGDMSSQLYEFLARPRPAAFIDAHDVRWRDDPRYAGWHLGVVARGAGDVLDAIDRAIAGQPDRVAAQEAAVALAFGSYHGAIARGADIIIDALDAQGR